MRAAGAFAVLAVQTYSGVAVDRPREHVNLLHRGDQHARDNFPGIIHTSAAEEAAKKFEKLVVEADEAQKEFSVPAEKHRDQHAADRFAELVGRLEGQLDGDKKKRFSDMMSRLEVQDVKSVPELEADAAHKFARLVSEPKPTQPPQLPDQIKKPLMSGINVMRTEMCWKRPNLMEHEKCMRFLGLHCAKQSTGEGICKGFKKKVAAACKDKSAKTPELQELQCELDEDLNGKHQDDSHPEGDDDGDGVANAEDLFPNNPKESADTDMDGVGDNADDDADGDGIKNGADGFPMDPKEWADTDGDGVGDNADDDTDGDGVPNADDAFPKDPNEDKDSDGDGIGDNSDLDRDGDGHNNDKDAHPDDPTRYPGSDMVGKGLPGIPKNLDLPFPGGEDEEVVEDGTTEGEIAADGSVDSDGDGVSDEDDPFPDDPSESADTDGDGVGDTSDVFPEDPSEQMDSDGDGVGDNADHFPEDPNESVDSDGDGFGDMSDGFPEDANEWQDSDGDGVGDNEDLYPNNPDCHKDPCANPTAVAPAPASAPAGAPGAPGAVPPMVMPWELNKVNRKLPPQGYNEHSKGSNDLVGHADMETWTDDWGKEWPHKKESEKASIDKICDKYPDSAWCRKYDRHGHFAR